MGISGRGAAVGVLPVTIVAALVTGCVALGMSDGRGPVSLANWDAAVVGESTLELTIPSCDGNPELTSLMQDDEVVRVEVVTIVQDEGPACADVLRVELDEPLGGREVIDATSGETMQLTSRY